MEQRIGILIGASVLLGAGAVVFLSLRTGPVDERAGAEIAGDGDAATSRTEPIPAGTAAPFREYPIGEVERAQERLHIAAVWLPPIQMEGMELPEDPDVIHLEADIHALAGNINGFGRGAWIPYLTVRYKIEPLNSGAESLQGAFMPMVAKDGPHYGATIRMGGPGKYRLSYEIEPPRAEFGRHSDPVTGVAPWWKPFALEFEFDYPGAAGSSEPQG